MNPPVRKFILDNLIDTTGSYSLTNNGGGGVTFVNDPTFGSVAQFDGSSYLVLNVADIPSGINDLDTSWSYTCWVYRTIEWVSIFGIGGAGDLTKVDLEIRSDTVFKISFDGGNANGSEVAPTSTQKNTWYHMCLVRDGQAFKWYLDGVLVIDHVEPGVNPLNLDLLLGQSPNSPTDELIHTGGMYDFRLYDYALSVSDVNQVITEALPVVPLLVEPSPINIPMVIAEVPGAIGYKIVYVNPSGVEITSTGTDLERNITGLVPDTEYVIKLYADTGSGYVLTEELTTTTLPNVAANYVVADLVEDGVINLSSLPEATISNITEVMNELFNTGDIVNVSVMGKPELNTSFINLEDILSIEELDGVLLPFVQASSTGQKVRVRLSDGSTDVDVNFDETENTITVNDTTYSPGDSFILDGKKVTVVEY